MPVESKLQMFPCLHRKCVAAANHGTNTRCDACIVRDILRKVQCNSCIAHELRGDGSMMCNACKASPLRR